MENAYEIEIEFPKHAIDRGEINALEVVPRG
jgi:hypothetical protein